jgi:hypothetical protein
MILHETRDTVEDGKPRLTKLYSASGMAKLVRRIRKLAKLPPTFTLDACRHGGMTELEDAELTDGQGRALSAHKSRAYEGVRQTNDGAGARGHQEAPRSSANERDGNRCSE